MNLPTKLTITRIVLSLLIIVLLLVDFYELGLRFPRFYVDTIWVDSKYLIAGVIFLIASLTDYLDGYIARKKGLVTNTGKMLDAIADKVLVNSVLIILAATNRIHAIIPVVIVLRDIIVNAIKMEAASKGKVVAAINSGKLKTAALMAGTFLEFFYNLPFEIWNVQVADFLLYFATIMSIVSMIEYYRINKKLIME